MSSPAFTPQQIAALKSVGDLARETGHTRQCVHKALRRNGIKPALTSPFSLYPAAVIEELRKIMRPPGRKRRHPLQLNSPTVLA